MPNTGLGMKVACKAVLLRQRLDGELEGHDVVGGAEGVGVLEVDLVLAGSHSWWEASISKPICSSVMQISRRVLSPWSSGPRSK